jgi:hypothetical protein
VRDARRQTPGEWRDGGWRADRAFGPELVWFPEPIGARECQLVREGVTTTVTTVPTARHATVRYGAPPTARRLASRLRRDPLDAGLGRDARRGHGTRERGSRRRSSTAWSTGCRWCRHRARARRARCSPGSAVTTAPARSACGRWAKWCTPVPFLTELAHRGVKAAAFVGVAPAA